MSTQTPTEVRSNVTLAQMMKPVTHRIADIRRGRLTEEITHPENKVFVDAITSNPTESTNWLVLADRLEDENNAAAHMIRLIFIPDYVPPTKFTGWISRSNTYYESGSQYTEGVSIRWNAEDGFVESISGSLSQGTTVHKITRQEAIGKVTQLTGRYVSRFSDLCIEGYTIPTSAFLPAGSSIYIRKDEGDQVDWKEYKTKEEIEVPIETKEHEPFSRWCWMKYRGYQLHFPAYACQGR